MSVRQRQIDAAKKSLRMTIGPVVFVTFFILIVIPGIVFLFSSIFATLLWKIECDDAQEFLQNAILQELEALNNGTNVTVRRALRVAAHSSGETADGQELDQLCSWYQWFKYITGNLLGVQITNIQPISGDPASEVIDLLVSTWSLGVTGAAIGIIGGMTSTTNFIDSLNQWYVYVGRGPIYDALKEATKKGAVLDRAAFAAILIEENIELSPQQLDYEFKRLDEDMDGQLDSHELQGFFHEVQGIPRYVRTSLKIQQDSLNRLSNVVDEIRLEMRQMRSELGVVRSQSANSRPHEKTVNLTDIDAQLRQPQTESASTPSASTKSADEVASAPTVNNSLEQLADTRSSLAREIERQASPSASNGATIRSALVEQQPRQKEIESSQQEVESMPLELHELSPLSTGRVSRNPASGCRSLIN